VPLNLNDPATWLPSTLYTPEGPIRYWVLADWEGYFEQYEDVNNLTRVLIAVSWHDAAVFKQYALGFAHRVGTATYFERYTPLPCPYQDAQYLKSLKKARIHAGANANSGTAVYHTPSTLFDNWPTFPETNGVPPRIIYDATFTCPDYEVVDQDAFVAVADRRELRRYVTREQQINPRERKVPSFGFETYDAANPATMVGALVVPIPEVGFVPDYVVELYYTWRRVPVDYVPGAAIANCLNKINNAAFDYLPGGAYGRFLTGTLLFRGPANRITPYRGPNAEWLVDLPYVFSYCPGNGLAGSWNTIARNDGSFAPIRVRGTNPPQPLYQVADFEPLFRPGP
jgi:hypothetical protein